MTYKVLGYDDDLTVISETEYDDDWTAAQDKAVELYSLEGEGHTWWNRNWGHDINTSELIWQFFKSQQ